MKEKKHGDENLNGNGRKMTNYPTGHLYSPTKLNVTPTSFIKNGLLVFNNIKSSC